MNCKKSEFLGFVWLVVVRRLLHVSHAMSSVTENAKKDKCGTARLTESRDRAVLGIPTRCQHPSNSYKPYYFRCKYYSCKSKEFRAFVLVRNYMDAVSH